MTENNEILEENNEILEESIPEVRNAKWNDSEHTSFDTELNHPDLGWIPFTVRDGDSPDTYCYKIWSIKDTLEIEEYQEPEIDLEELRQEEISELKEKLANSDYKAIKYAEGQISEEEYANVRELRQSYRDRINELEELIND